MSYKVRIEMDGYKCLRCEHEWVPRIIKNEEPTICPKCKSPYWNKPRRIITREASGLIRKYKTARRGSE